MILQAEFTLLLQYIHVNSFIHLARNLLSTYDVQLAFHFPFFFFILASSYVRLLRCYNIYMLIVSFILLAIF